MSYHDGNLRLDCGARGGRGASRWPQADGRKRVTPYWRTLKTGGEVNPKYPGGVAAQRILLETEGHKVVKKGKRFLVVDFEKRVVTPMIR